ncbi:mechanosensitive ion channel family protein [Rhodocaloribacter litoris]|uniref:mechanosensitive ion channel family protein n=1 Tax=Rhodocaloribacter litoris TaxID=2558931 RepID=UPI001420B754|nr:mechanosensitive ion channel family protein [Rhodocaloribacter litoris]QXD16502.1 mechanosensitive ion channel family protein [Rhodocaloribacter litoris]
MSRLFPGLAVALLVLAACQRPEPAAPETRTDTTTVSPDTTRTARVDTATVAPADTLVTRLPGPISPETLDSLRREIEALRTLLADRERPARPDTTPRAATADTLSVGTRLRTTAEGLEYIGLRVTFALLVLVVTFFAIKGLVWLFDTLAERSATRRLLFKKLIPITRLLIWTLTLYYIIAVVFSISESQLFAASAAFGVAVGFAAQDVLKNIFGGLIIVLDQPFQVGDKISVGGTYGEVVSIGLRSTRIVTLDDNLVSVPNSQVVDGQVANANAGALDCQVVTHLYLPGWVDVKKAKEIAYRAAATSKYVYLDKPIVVIVRDEFKETFLTHLVVKAYVIDTRYESAFSSDVTEQAKTEFLRHGMLVPFYRPAPIGDGGPTGKASETP